MHLKKVELGKSPTHIENEWLLEALVLQIFNI